MTTFIALLRAVDVGGTGKLPMAELRAMATRAGFSKVQTYIASGNLVFESDGRKADVAAVLGEQLHAYAGKLVDVLIRTADEMAGVLAINPFPMEPPNRTFAIFLPSRPSPEALAEVRYQTTEKIGLGDREIYVAYGDTMGRSRLVIPTAGGGTARNINTVAALGSIASNL
jgi:uncharacterized protein (DUF1697 family)